MRLAQKQIKTSLNFSLPEIGFKGEFEAFANLVISELSNIFGGLQYREQKGVWSPQSVDFGKTSYKDIERETGYLIEFCSEWENEEIDNAVYNVFKLAASTFPNVPVNWINYEQSEVITKHFSLEDLQK